MIIATRLMMITQAMAVFRRLAKPRRMNDTARRSHAITSMLPYERRDRRGQS
jgi:hypothetical protein